MTLLTSLQFRCLAILQRRHAAKKAGAVGTYTVAWELEKTNKQAMDCLNRLTRKGLVIRAGRGLWALTSDGCRHPNPFPPGE